ncbi:MAG: hypothetical protein V7K57_20020 [Nostoc sp.]
MWSYIVHTPLSLLPHEQRRERGRKISLSPDSLSSAHHDQQACPVHRTWFLWQRSQPISDMLQFTTVLCQAI